MRRPSFDRSGTLVGLAFGAIGVVLLAFAAFLGRADSRLAAEGETAFGTVVDFRVTRTRRSPGTGTGNNSSKFVNIREPVIHFVTRRGEAIEFVALNGSFPEGLEEGDAVDVVYLPDDPRGAEVRGSSRLSGGAIAVAVLGATSLVPALFLVAWPAWQRRRHRTRLLQHPRRLQRIEAQVIELHRLRRNDADGIWSLQVTAEWRDPSTGRAHRFESARMRFDPALFARVRQLGDTAPPSEAAVREILIGARLPVRVHPDDPAHYEAESLRLPGVTAADA